MIPFFDSFIVLVFSTWLEKSGRSGREKGHINGANKKENAREKGNSLRTDSN